VNLLVAPAECCLRLHCRETDEGGSGPRGMLSIDSIQVTQRLEALGFVGHHFDEPVPIDDVQSLSRLQLG
jgi:hypothetical protein